MADSIPKIPVSMGYNQLKNEAMKDLMDILKGRENTPLKPSAQVKSDTNKNLIEQGNDTKERFKIPINHRPLIKMY